MSTSREADRIAILEDLLRRVSKEYTEAKLFEKIEDVVARRKVLWSEVEQALKPRETCTECHDSGDVWNFHTGVFEECPMCKGR